MIDHGLFSHYKFDLNAINILSILNFQIFSANRGIFGFQAAQSVRVGPDIVGRVLRGVRRDALLLERASAREGLVRRRLASDQGLAQDHPEGSDQQVVRVHSV